MFASAFVFVQTIHLKRQWQAKFRRSKSVILCITILVSHLSSSLNSHNSKQFYPPAQRAVKCAQKIFHPQTYVPQQSC